MNEINIIDSIIDYLETSSVYDVDGNDIDSLKAHSNELKIGLGIIEDDENYHGKNILWNNINKNDDGTIEHRFIADKEGK